jgi:DNA-binding NarL/FixJ family response regulator
VTEAITTLIVDDEPSIRELTRLLIETDDDGLEVVGEVGDGRAALDAVAALHPEVVLLDVLMPGGIDGYEVAARILAETPQQRIILFSASFGPGQQERALSIGVRECLDKTDVIEVPAAIRRVAAVA